MSDVLLTIDEEEAKVIERALMVASANVALFPDIEGLINKVKEARKNGNNNVGKNIKFIPSSYSNADIARDYFSGGSSLSDYYGRRYAGTTKPSDNTARGHMVIESTWECCGKDCIYEYKGSGIAPVSCPSCGSKTFKLTNQSIYLRPDIWNE